jgi:hypothetical protein
MDRNMWVSRRSYSAVAGALTFSLCSSAFADDVSEIAPLPDRSLQAPQVIADKEKVAIKNWLVGQVGSNFQQIASGADVGTQLARVATDSIEYLVGGFHLPDWMGRVEVEIEFTGIESEDDLKPEISVITVQPLYQSDNKSDTFFAQLQANHGYQFGDERIWTNTGLGYRRILNKDTMVGLNSFIDYDVEEHHLRTSLGAELKFNSMDVSTNYYRALSGTKTVSSTLSEKALSGWDLEARSQIPYMPWARAGLRHFQWNTDRANEDISGYEVSLEIDVHQNMQFELSASDHNLGEMRYQARLRFVAAPQKTRGPVAMSNQFISQKAFESRDLRDHTLDKVRRENRIILEGQSSGVVIARGN